MVVIFINGIVIKEKFVLFIRKRLVVELDIIIFSGKENKEGIGKKLYYYIFNFLLIWMRIIGYLMICGDCVYYIIRY